MGSIIERFQGKHIGDSFSAVEVIEKVALRDDNDCHRKCLLNTIVVLGEVLRKHMDLVVSLSTSFDILEGEEQDDTTGDDTKEFRMAVHHLRDTTAQLMDIPVKDAVDLMVRARRNGVPDDTK